MSYKSNRKLKDWRTFIKIVEKKSISAAAEALFIETSTASKYLTKLEEEMGLILIERNTRSMNVTPQGHEVYERMKLIMGDIDDLFRELDDKKKHMTGALRIAAPAIACEFLLSEYIVDFQKIHSQASFHLHAIGRHENINPADFDLIIRGRGGVPIDESLVHRKMDNLNLIVCASATYMENHGVISHPADLADHELLTLWDHVFSGTVSFSKQEKENYTLFPQSSRFTTNNVLAQFNLMLRGGGISVATPAWLAHDYMERGDIVQLLTDWKIQEFEIDMLWHPRKYYSQLFLAFTDYLHVRWRDRAKIKIL